MESELIAETTRGRLAGSQRCRSLDLLLAPGINAGRFASQAILLSAGETSPNAKVMVSGITLFRTAKPARCLKSNRAPVSIPTAQSMNGEAGRRANYRALMETKFTDGSPGP
ncbi:Oidioi.mRNA.OKI2018_I69.chr2.g4046.t1.cds [Oikopleura dioica]|uniref:Oidioi.mRNA.OKI2018_I69.chr2.g4046.t1.cds n=1 Tax=Oikopleura dioica TaxID=34765 RepID=A0ABN7SW32_OIKDI|nr:Oidioi.mRNA.OKI2018_I69.chr2.g4046.t1.cds [Oikopleura dioica]